jgi:HlyD family secretion protein
MIGSSFQSTKAVFVATASAAVLFATSIVSQTSEDTGTAVPSVTVATARTMEFQAIAFVSGTVQAKDEILITPRVGGVQILQVLVDVGDVVTKGDVLIRLDKERLEAELAQSQAQLARAHSAIGQANNQIASSEASLTRAKTEYERAQQLQDSGNLSNAAFDVAFATFEAARASAASAKDGLSIAEAEERQAEAQKHIAELNLSWTQIVAPVDGVISSRNANVGSLTSLGGDPLLKIIESGTLEIAAEAIETTLNDIEPGEEVRLEVAGIGDLLGVVRLVSPTVDPVTRLGEVMITPEGHPGLRAGLYASGQIVTTRRNAVAVPVTSVLTGADGPYVQTVTDGVVEARPVTPGLVWQSEREIISGLEDGEQVIARSGAFFRDGDRVRAVEPSE